MRRLPPSSSLRITALLAFGALVAANATAESKRSFTIVSSTGETMIAFERSTATRGHDGFAGRLGADEASDAFASIPARAETPEEIWKLILREAKSAPVGRESVIGADNRAKIKKTTKYPARAIGWLLFDDQFGDSFSCTAFLVSEDTIVTAGHCVHDGSNSDFGWSENVVFIPGRNGSASPYGSCNAVELFTNNIWFEEGAEEFDFGAAKLDCNIGDGLGFFGYWWQSATLNKTPTTVQGYPGDKPDGTQWAHTLKVTASDEFQVFYQADTFGGQSGSPVFHTNRTKGFCRGECVFGIHAYGLARRHAAQQQQSRDANQRGRLRFHSGSERHRSQRAGFRHRLTSNAAPAAAAGAAREGSRRHPPPSAWRRPAWGG